MRVTAFPLFIFTAASAFSELARKLREMLYLNRHPHSLDPAPLRHWLPDFRETPIDDVIAAHLTALALQGSTRSTQTG